VEVKIGVQNVARELVIDSAQSGQDVEAALSSALSEGEPILVLTDSKGRKVIVPIDKLAYVEIGSPVAGQVGFRT
jgi:hypothetical protein